MKDCIFCKIANGSIPANTVYEDELVKVFMDANPVSEGHLLIVPKHHYTDINEMPIGMLTHCMEISKKMFKGLKETLNVDGLTLTQNNEYGQEVKHYHLHLIPRYIGDNINFNHKDNRNTIDDVFKKLSK